MLSPYSVTLVPTGGLAPFTWTLDSGTLPPGSDPEQRWSDQRHAAYHRSRIRDGIAKKYSFTVRVTDSQTPTAAYQKGGFSITINPLAIVTSTTLPDAFMGVVLHHHFDEQRRTCSVHVDDHRGHLAVRD